MAAAARRVDGLQRQHDLLHHRLEPQQQQPHLTTSQGHARGSRLRATHPQSQSGAAATAVVVSASASSSTPAAVTNTDTTPTALTAAVTARHMAASTAKAKSTSLRKKQSPTSKTSPPASTATINHYFSPIAQARPQQLQSHPNPPAPVPQSQSHPQSLPARTKRPLDPVDSNLDAPSATKRPRIAAETLARPKKDRLAQPALSTAGRSPVLKQTLLPAVVGARAPAPPAASSQASQALRAPDTTVASTPLPPTPPQTSLDTSQSTAIAEPTPAIAPPPTAVAAAAVSKTASNTAPEVLSQPSPSPPSPSSLSNATAVALGSAPPAPPQTAIPASTPQAPARNHRDKFANDLKHELDRLQSSTANPSSEPSPPASGPAAAPDESNKKDGGDKGSSGRRKLRSQEATRFKSELSSYFIEYDEVIGNDPKEEQTLDHDTPILVVDSSSPTARAGDLDPSQYPVHSYGDSLFANLHDATRVDFSFLGPSSSAHLDEEDPLPDSAYGPAHKKAERVEKSIRNTERNRAQHERDQIARLLNDLQGHDWLRTMGVSGVTESRKKSFEPARDHFIKSCQIVLDKFRAWGLEEKRRKLERERALAKEADSSEESSESESEAAEEEEVDADDSDVVMSDSIHVEAEVGDSMEEDSDDDPGNVSAEDPPELSDVDASIARQLADEASAIFKTKATDARKPRDGELVLQVEDPYVYKEFTSFFDKKHQRDAAVSGRRRGRAPPMAWGHVIPDIPEVDFDLPEEYRDEETLKAHARQKRRSKRERRN